MAERKRITGNKKKVATKEDRARRLDAKTSEWKHPEYTCNFCWTGFLIDRAERGGTKATMDFYSRFFKKFTGFLDFHWKCEPKDMPIELLTTDMIQALFMSYLTQQGLGVQTVNSYLRAYRAWGNWAEEEGYLDGFKCPIKEVEPPATLINYVKLTCNIDTLNVNTDGVMSFTLKGNYFNGSFGSVSNSLTVQYRYKTDGGSYSSWTSATATKSGNTYTATGSVSGLDYQTTYVFQARALDKVYDGTYQTARSTSEKKVSAKPIFDWDSDDFNFNVPVSITDGDTKYWVSGAVKAMSKYYNLTTTVTPGANYSSASGAAVLLGNNLRVNFKATRSSSIAAGNVANEAMCTLEIAHGGKIGNVWGSYFPILECGGMGYITNIANDTTTNILSITMTLASVQLASSSFQSYFVLPVRLNLNAY